MEGWNGKDILIDSGGTDFRTVSATRTSIVINNRIQTQDFRLQISDFKLKTSNKNIFTLYALRNAID